MWTPTTRKQHSRPAARYQTDLTDAEWKLIEAHIPEAGKTGRRRMTSWRPADRNSFPYPNTMWCSLYTRRSPGSRSRTISQ